MVQVKIKAVEMTRQIRDKNYERLRGMSRAERLEYFREQARLMNEKAETLLKSISHDEGHS